ncbi:hypothetical protein [Singulisphaera sp. PoT]
MEWLHDLHSDDMIFLGTVSLLSGVVFGVVAKLAGAGLRRRKAL